MANEDNRKFYEQWEVEKLVDSKIKAAIKENDAELKAWLGFWIIIQLAPFRPWLSAIKFIATAVALLVIGTAYQVFVSLASSGIGR
jgi:hypothetical protein